jgi:ribosomal protein S14
MRLNYKDRLKRSKIPLFENKKKCFKTLKINKKLWSSWWSRHKLSSFPKQRIKNRCIITQRGRSIKRHFKLSRIELKRWVKHRILFGVKISSW